MKLLTIVLALSLFSTTACVVAVDGEDDTPDWVDEDDSSGSDTNGGSSYSNRVKLECNGDVMVDRVFTDRAACQSFASSNEFYCGSIRLPISC